MWLVVDASRLLLPERFTMAVSIMPVSESASQARIDSFNRVIKRKEAPHRIMSVMLSFPCKCVHLAPIMNVTTPGIQILHHNSSGLQVHTDKVQVHTDNRAILPNLVSVETPVSDDSGKSVDLPS